MFTLAEVLDLAIQIEKNGQLFYLNAMESAADPQLKALLAWMAEEEQNHRAWFEQWRRRPELVTGNPLVEEMTSEVLGDLLGRRTFSLEQVDLKALACSDQMLAAALEFERDTVLFYEILIGFVTDKQVLDQIPRILAEERNHIDQLLARQAAGT